MVWRYTRRLSGNHSLVMPGKGAWSVGIGGGEGGGDARRAAAGAVELAAHAVTAALRKAFLTSLTHTREPVAGEE